MFVLFLLIMLLIFYFLCLKPNPGRRELMEPFTARYIAHRGLYDNSSEAPENSVLAFRRAVQAGYGIELDVQLTLDHRMVVFHDYTLKRMCGVQKRLALCTYQELGEYRLKDSDQRIPLFTDVLAEINGRAPVIVEIKAEENCEETTRAAAEILSGYEGVYCVESFHPKSVAWYRKHAPQVARGQLASDFMQDGTERPVPVRWALSNLLFNGYAKPDFIAYNHIYQDQFSYRLCRRLFHPVNAAWTIRSQEELEQAKKVFDIIIFESFLPDQKAD